MRLRCGAAGAGAAMLLALVGFAGAPASAQDAPAATPPAQEPAAEPAPSEPAPESASDLPSLDDLLGTQEQKPADTDAAEGAPGLSDPNRAELERKLTAMEAREQLKQAVAQMEELADRLEKSRDPGLATQRLQEEILKKLDVLIKNSQQQSSSSSSSSSSSQQQQQQQQQRGPQQPQNQNDAGSAENRGEVMAPAPQSAELRPTLEAAKAAWGALPARVRDALIQGSSDHYSSLYEAMTQEYYRRLAKESDTEQ